MKYIITLFIFVVAVFLLPGLVRAQNGYCCQVDICCKTPTSIKAVCNKAEFPIPPTSEDACRQWINAKIHWDVGCYGVFSSRSGASKQKAKDPANGKYACLSESEMYQTGTCIWTLANNCGDIDNSLTLQTDETRCSGAKPNGTTAKCCCPISKSHTAYKQSKSLTAPSIPNPLDCDTIPCVIGRVIAKMLTILGAVALLVFIYGGFRWLTAAGNDQSIAAGKETLVWATIGIIFIFLSYILVGFILQSLGV